MKKSVLLSLALLLMSWGIYAQIATAPAVGDGTISNPYQIATLENLYWMAVNPAVWGMDKYFVQTADIDASDTKDWCNGGWLPIGEDAIYNLFSGHYDGQNHTISGLYITGSSKKAYGLFGYVGKAEFKNLGITKVYIDAQNATYAGALLGSVEIEVTIDNCYSTGVVKGYNNTGGLAGILSNYYVNGNTTIHNSYSTCDVSGFISVGGLVGSIYSNVSVVNCFHSGGMVEGNDGTGGMIGLNCQAIISKCFSTGEVKGSSGNGTGGLVGINSLSAIYNSYSRCTVTNLSSVQACGGLAGLIPSNLGYMSGSYITNCYSTGSVQAGMGGLVGRVDEDAFLTITNSFWDTQTSGTTTSAGGTGKTTAEMKIQSTFTDWDFTTIWGMHAGLNDGYPSLVPATFTLASGSNTQTICEGTTIVPIVYEVDGFVAGVTLTPGSPSGLSGIYDQKAGTFTISGNITDAGSYTYTATTSCTLPACIEATATGTITVNESFTPSVTVTSEAAYNAICANSQVIFTATPHNTGGGTVAYQWYYYNKLQNTLYGYLTWNRTTWTSNELEDGDEVYCEITVTGGTCLTSTTATSDKITMEVYDRTTQPTVSIESNPSGEICPNTAVTFMAITENTKGATVSYQWYYYRKEENKTYDYDSWNRNPWTFIELEDGDKVYCKITVTDAACYESAIATSNIITISVTPWPDAGEVTGKNLIEVGESTTLKAEMPGGEWFCFDTDIATVDANGMVTGTGEGNAEIYYVLPLDGVQLCNYTEAVTEFPIVVSSLPCTDPTDGGEIAGNQTICSGTDPAIFANVSEASGYVGILEYKWQYSDANDPYDWEDLASSNSVYYDDSQTTISTRWYRRLARVTCSPGWTGTAASNVLEVTVKPQPTLTGFTFNQETLCEENELHQARITFTFDGLLDADNRINTTFIKNENTDEASTGDLKILQSDLMGNEGSWYYEITNYFGPGSYQINVNSISANGCTTTFDENEKPSVSWTVYPQPAANISGELVACEKTILTAETDASSASYVWLKYNGAEVTP